MGSSEWRYALVQDKVPDLAFYISFNAWHIFTKLTTISLQGTLLRAKYLKEMLCRRENMTKAQLGVR